MPTPAIRLLMAALLAGCATTNPAPAASGTATAAAPAPAAASAAAGGPTCTGNGAFTFSGVENLVGGTGIDTFKLSPAGSVASIHGASSADWLDYSLFTTAVTVNLATGSARVTVPSPAITISRAPTLMAAASSIVPSRMSARLVVPPPMSRLMVAPSK